MRKVPTFENCKTIGEVLFQAMGFASVCWDNMENTGEFQVTLAKEAGEAALARIEEMIRKINDDAKRPF